MKIEELNNIFQTNPQLIKRLQKDFTNQRGFFNTSISTRKILKYAEDHFEDGGRDLLALYVRELFANRILEPTPLDIRGKKRVNILLGKLCIEAKDGLYGQAVTRLVNDLIPKAIREKYAGKANHICEGENIADGFLDRATQLIKHGRGTPEMVEALSMLRNFLNEDVELLSDGRKQIDWDTRELKDS